MKTIAISIDENILTRIDRFIEQHPGKTVNRSSVIRQAVHEHLSRLERIAEEEREKVVFQRNRDKLGQQAKALVREQAKP